MQSWQRLWYKMKKEFSKHWKSSKQPRKQRKYVHNAPLHILRSFFNAHLSKDLNKKYGKRSFPLRKGDVVKISRGQYKGKSGKVDKVNTKRRNIYIDEASFVKKDGSKVFYPVHPSNVMIIELNLEDKKRKKALERK